MGQIIFERWVARSKERGHPLSTSGTYISPNWEQLNPELKLAINKATMDVLEHWQQGHCLTAVSQIMRMLYESSVWQNETEEDWLKLARMAGRIARESMAAFLEDGAQRVG